MKPTNAKIEREMKRLRDSFYGDGHYESWWWLARHVLRRIAAAEKRGAMKYRNGTHDWKMP